jgi:hypothetical protein
MKKKIWSRANIPNTRPTGLWIHFSPKNGAITFSKDLTEKHQIGKNGVLFIQDEDRPIDWYLEITRNNPDAFFPRRKKTGKGCLIQSALLCREIMSSSGLTMESQRVLVSAQEVEPNVYSVITKSGQPKKSK